MPLLPSTLDACRSDLFTSREDLEKKYLPVMVSRIIRIREAYNMLLANPDMKDKAMVDFIMSHYPDTCKSQAYDDLNIIKTLLPALAQNSKEFHRWRFTELIMETYQLAKRRKDTKTMERALASYAKYSGLDKEEQDRIPFDVINVQPFIPTMDVSVLGLKPIPNCFDYIAKLSKELLADFPDVVDVEAEEADLNERELFTPLRKEEDGEP